MADSARSISSAARFGLTDPRAEQDLRAAGLWGDAGPQREVILSALSRSPDPDLALRGLDRVREADEGNWLELRAELESDRRLRARLIAVLGSSTAFADYLAAHPDQWRRLDGGGTAVEDYTSALYAAVEATGDTPTAAVRGHDAVRVLKSAYRGLLMEVAADDLGYLVDSTLPHPDYDHVARQLSELAEAALRAALAVAWAETGGQGTARLAVIAMGKCGGGELNYVSDVDVVFVGEDDTAVATRVASAMMRVATEACFEVDAGLRPEGRNGALVRTLDGHSAYYKRWAKTWEFQALLKARPVAGDAELGQAYLDVVTPMVWTAADRENFVPEVQAMRRRVEDHVPAELVHRELKLGRGGLRDVEFAVQLLQLVHGRTDELLRLGSTVDALAALGAGGFVGRTDAAELADSYRFLRTLEHRLQLQRLRRTHLFPADSETDELRWLARASGIGPERGRNAAQVLLADFRRHTNRIRRLHEKLFYRPLLDAVARVPTEQLRLTTNEAHARLAALGYSSPQGALQHIKALTEGVSRRAAIQTAILPVLLDLLGSTPDPDGGLLAYRKVSEALSSTPWYLRVLRDEGAVAERLATLLGTSKLVPDLVVRAPEVLRLLAEPKELALRSSTEVAEALRAAVKRHGYLGNAVAAARSLRRHELLRIACADLLGFTDVLSVCSALSSVWSAVLQASLDAVDRAEAAAAGGHLATISVIAMGRLGGSELGYGSDADVMFVCEPAPGVEDSDALKYAGRVAQTVRKLLGSPTQDPPLQVDVDLRPEGRQGPIVRTLESYRAYYAQWGEIWEAQALLRAHPVAGDPDLGARFIQVIDPIRYPAGGLDPAQVREIRRIKARVDTERLPRGADPATHTKLGRGGLADVEWTVQLLQLRHAHTDPALRTTSTMDGLTAATASGLLTPDDAGALREAWLLATQVRNAATLVRGKQTDQLPTHGRELAAVAAAMGTPLTEDPGKFLDDYRRTTRHARAVVEHVFYD
ncbi:bifunctional [glutamine synthetase] adenylyltransferase/[glutamine synthetase]-adenylyl-L-tyrosine phosphorylase [Actinokineospora globicatena]|uniref:bifunctional [glutamine synthetase] adenylyltransferase/[glutamine synthetase]-adenylyl-L-tyrosine phosphorylase n=1 Tax=Actinokineospora globicatena TaxID=103729 RepID=UPI0020A4737F|nr:bifunctional [glutamine synthetase] adenylyltransferase/[glutamine synthetase]-adenylyl-L-tyrosine phosphorylase [Actinokineospora globicatena]MCP2304948.1 glutamate-ammonia-ligase adenylyltransferase [Actinokineospora globicatena]GLW80407.1 glutamate-ammonia-ligase adenylyltransferase [Actinokineospora globicatena]GLW87236.1 glutamate-ammonia-ligase adenylyltransferase [Actinokineospora globicatena]